MHSSYLDQLLVLGDADLQQAVRLASFFCPEHAIAIFASAAKNWDEDVLRPRRTKRSGTHYKIVFPDSRVDRVWFRFHILAAAVQHAKECQIPRAEARWWALYLAHFAQLPRTSPVVTIAVFFDDVLACGAPAEVLRLCQRVAPTGIPGVTSNLLADKRKALLEEAHKHFSGVFLAQGGRLVFDEVAKTTRPEVFQILEKLTPPDHAHLPQHKREWDEMTAPAPDVENADWASQNLQRLALAELSIEQDKCLRRVKEWNNDLADAFAKWRLPRCQERLVDRHDDPWVPPSLPDWPKLRRELVKEILMLEWETSNAVAERDGKGARFQIVVDGEPKGYVRQGRSTRESVPPFARYLEVRHVESGISVANCHLLDPEELPDRGLKASMKLVAGTWIHLAIYRDRRPAPTDGQSLGTVVEVRHRAGVMAEVTTTLRGSIEVLRQWRGRLRQLSHAPMLSLRSAVKLRSVARTLQPATVGILLIVVVAQQYLYQKQRAEQQAQTGIVTTLAAESREAAQLRATIQTSGAEGVASRLEVAVTAVGGRAYPFPSLRKEAPAVTSLIAEEVARSPVVKASYEAYLWQWSEILRVLGGTLAEAGKVSEATAVFEYLVESSREPASNADRERLLGLLYGLGELRKMKGDHRGAVQIYETIIARGLAPGDPRPAHFAGWSSYELGEYDTARRYYEAALRIDPRYAKAYYNLALVFRDLGQERLYRENLDKAVKLTRQALQREGDANPRIPFSLAIFATAQGKLDEALELLERTLQADHLYVVRAEKERAFGVFRDPANEPHFSRFRSLLDHYLPPRAELGGPSGSYNPSVFNE